MLVSAVLVVRPLCEGQVPTSLGRAIQSLFYRWMAATDEKLASGLHDSQQAKPFSVSNLCLLTRSASQTEPLEAAESNPLEPAAPDKREEEGPGEGRLPYRPGRTDLVTVSPGQEYWFRFTTYHPSLSEPLLEKVLTALPTEFKLLEVPFGLVEVITDPACHLWAGTDTYEAISARQMLNPAPSNLFSFRFASPTVFKYNKHSLALPVPELVFGSLLNKWNENAPLTLSEELRRYARECIFPLFYRLGTRPINFEEFQETGFTGICQFQATNRDRYWLGMLGSLAEFAFYSGIGHRTTMGLGQVRPLPARPPVVRGG
jgi:CRISPR-associated endoribonuclease Cas6